MIKIPFRSKTLSISMMVPSIAWVVGGYRSNSIQVSDGQGKEEWAVSLQSAFKVLTQEARFPFDTRRPVLTEKFTRHVKMEFAKYLADPYYTDPDGLSPLFSRRRHIFEILLGPVLSLSVAGMTFKESKHGSTLVDPCEPFVQGFGCIFVVVWCHFFWQPMWKVGWVLKMGAIARQIRRGCIKSGGVKGSKGDGEKSWISVDAKEMLEWFQESWKAYEDEHDILQSELFQLEDNCEEPILV